MIEGVLVLVVVFILIKMFLLETYNHEAKYDLFWNQYLNGFANEPFINYGGS